MRPEILAPGGSLEAIGVAVANGADAIYAGVGSLNARARARNLTTSEVSLVASVLHDADRKLYVTLNLPLRPEHIKETAKTLVQCFHAGVDAVIVRDEVLMEAVATFFPEMALHASTQTGAITPDDVQRLKDLGCTRVVLPRELSKAEIAIIKHAVPDMELEVFVFGAMCFAVSGKCLLGEAVSGRSGNYGNCSQPCRLPYTDMSGNPCGHIFSMKDLDLFPRLAELERLGVHALKIEGRLKSPAWVGCVTRWLRVALDRNPLGLTETEFATFDRDVRSIFSRPRTSAFFDGVTEYPELITKDAPGHRGLEIRDFKVVRGGKAIRFRAPVALNIRDGLIAIVGPSQKHVPFPITGIREASGKRLIRAEEGETIEVPLPVKGLIKGLAVHSSDPVRVKYENDDKGIPAKIRRGLPLRPVHVAVHADRIEALFMRGRFKHHAQVAICSERARNEGLSREMLASYFGDCETFVEKGLYINPSELKRARRVLSAIFEEAWKNVIEKDAARIESFLLASQDRFILKDADLLATGPAAISRVTNMKEGTFFTPTGHMFKVKSDSIGTTVHYCGKVPRGGRGIPDVSTSAKSTAPTPYPRSSATGKDL